MTRASEHLRRWKRRNGWCKGTGEGKRARVTKKLGFIEEANQVGSMHISKNYMEEYKEGHASVYVLGKGRREGETFWNLPGGGDEACGGGNGSSTRLQFQLAATARHTRRRTQVADSVAAGLALFLHFDEIDGTPQSLRTSRYDLRGTRGIEMAGLFWIIILSSSAGDLYPRLKVTEPKTNEHYATLASHDDDKGRAYVSFFFAKQIGEAYAVVRSCC
ncbi:hypothetical protein B296_00002404 [Ensete ventricosum]|uniref:Uncharacterized protein n=1 Tax=Ensete ventricosum TaxID=4639 RepID=A0A427ACC4_ENSVE|nr:hypothetical protein B296_00002404 [Ensete ventricosum]